jgi:3-oxoacyl-[acyl-carrier-protein] synthase II
MMAKVIRTALQRAGAKTEDVDHINAQGLATERSDRWESKAIHDVFGPKTPVWSMKGNIGSSGAAASAVEVVGSVLTLQRGQLPPTRNCEQPDPVCAINVHRDGTRPVTKPFVVKLNYTDMGQVGVAVLKRWDG